MALRERPLAQGRNRHLQIIDGLPFGDDIKQGIIRGQRFVHPDLQLEFSVPKKFTLKNAPDRVTATHKNGMEIIFDLAGRKEAQRPFDYIRSCTLYRSVDGGSLIKTTPRRIGLFNA